MDYEHWETFLALADTHSFSRTAELLHISQTTVTNRIKQLENKVGKLLFVRDTRSVRLSEAGLALYPYAKKGLELLKQGELVAKNSIDFDEILAIGSHVSIWHYFLLPYIHELRNQSQYTLRFFTGHTKRMLDLLMDGRLDACVVPTPPHHPYLEGIELFQESFQLVASPFLFTQVPLHLTSEELRTLPFIHIPWESPFLDWFHQDIGTRLLPSIEVDDTTVLTRLLLNHKMLAFLPELVARSFIQSGELISIPFRSLHPIPKRSIYLVFHKKNRYSRAFLDFKRLLLSGV
ncbi:LysR family transcriptional regulator [Ammoniphilus sp. CFH 90114]|uniref:LysR family transcriptional regulator n=1 Tax=Ammoniphilus sp. CFH 90114 TaxID=2493665 RepID=UPI0013E93560|nr:LysR family transcriptional regulator [Ammoniphilus sp. CFH 90114]